MAIVDQSPEESTSQSLLYLAVDEVESSIETVNRDAVSAGTKEVVVFLLLAEDDPVAYEFALHIDGDKGKISEASISTHANSECAAVYAIDREEAWRLEAVRLDLALALVRKDPPEGKFYVVAVGYKDVQLMALPIPAI